MLRDADDAIVQQGGLGSFQSDVRAACMIAMGANVSGLGTHELISEGSARLTGSVHDVLPDRIVGEIRRDVLC